MLSEKTHDVGGLTINYAEAGSGDPLLMLHGVSQRWQYWSQEVGLLSHRFHVFALDARGHGKSSHDPARNYGLEAMTQDVINFLEVVVGGPAIIVGHSLGSMTTAAVAATRPDLVRAAVLSDSPIYADLRWTPSHDRFQARRDLLRTNPTFDEVLQAVREDNPAQDATAHRKIVENCLQMDPEAFTSHIEKSFFGDIGPDALLSRIECPVLLLQAEPEMGAAMQDEDRDRALRHIRDAVYVRFDGVGHSISVGDPIRFRRALFDFLDSLD